MAKRESSPSYLGDLTPLSKTTDMCSVVEYATSVSTQDAEAGGL